MNDELFERMSEEIRKQVEQTWVVTTEINGNGKLIERAVMRDFPLEIVNGQCGMYQLYLN